MCITKAVKNLQIRHLSHHESVEIVNKSIEDFKSGRGKVANVVTIKMESVLFKNPGYEEICKIDRCFIKW